MRYVIAALALVLAACDGASPSSGADAHAAGGYTIQIDAAGDVQTFLITAPDGRVVGARTADGISALLDESRARSLVGEAPPEDDGSGSPVMALRVPGFEMSVAGSGEDASGENGRVSLSIGGEQNVEVVANEGGPGSADDRAFVRISGADEAAVREFIGEAEEFSAETKAELLAALNLN